MCPELAHADDGEEASALGSLFSEAEKEVAAAGGAEVADKNVSGEQAGAKKLGTICLAEVEEDVLGRGLVARGHHVEPLDGIGFVACAEFVEPIGGLGELREKLAGDFRADFVTAAANGWADRGEQVGRFCFEVHLHLADSLDHDACQGAAPAGVNGGDSALFRVHEENGDAVGSLDAQEKAWAVGCGGISAARLGGHGVEKMDNVGMDLLERDELKIGCAKGGLEKAAVFKDVFFGIPFGETEIENAFAVQLADTAKFGAEAVN